jgi:hypothetical protein
MAVILVIVLGTFKKNYHPGWALSLERHHVFDNPTP